ncbi:MAG: hypothetical protein RLZZ604_1044, partial [Pseudomonadota bacterium]
VFGGFALAGGHFEVIIEAAPMEFMMIFGAAVGALIVGIARSSAVHLMPVDGSIAFVALAPDTPVYRHDIILG